MSRKKLVNVSAGKSNSRASCTTPLAADHSIGQKAVESSVFDFDSSTQSTEDCQHATLPTVYDAVSHLGKRAVSRASSDVVSPRDKRAAARASSSVISPQGKRALARDTASKVSADAESNVLSPRDKRALFRTMNAKSTMTNTTTINATADTTTLHEDESLDEGTTTTNPTAALEVQCANALVEYEPQSPLHDTILGNPTNANAPFNALDIYHVLSPFHKNVLQVLSLVQQAPYGTVCHVTFPPVAPVDCQMHDEQIMNGNIEEASNNSTNSLRGSGSEETKNNLQDNNLQSIGDKNMASFFSNYGYAMEGAKVGCGHCVELTTVGNSEFRHSPWCPSQHGRQSSIHEHNASHIGAPPIPPLPVHVANATHIDAPPIPPLPVHVATESARGNLRRKNATKKSASSVMSSTKSHDTLRSRQSTA